MTANAVSIQKEMQPNKNVNAPSMIKKIIILSVNH